MSKRRYVYYQPNKMSVKDNFGDCTIRALSKALNLSWMGAYLLTIPICLRMQTHSIFALPRDLEQSALKELGFVYHGVSNKKGTRRPTVDLFAKEHPTGRYICHVAHHEVAVVNGKYYDTWDSGECYMYGWYECVAEIQDPWVIE